MTTGCRVKACHAAQLGFCVTGQETLLRRYNIDAVRFYGDGIPVEELAGIRNALIRRVIEQAELEWEKEKRPR